MSNVLSEEKKQQVIALGITRRRFGTRWTRCFRTTGSAKSGCGRTVPRWKYDPVLKTLTSTSVLNGAVNRRNLST